VLLVVHLAKSGTGNAGASGTSTPTGSSSAPSATASTTKYTLSAPGTAGPYQKNTTATTDFAKFAQNRAALVMQQIKSRGAGTPGSNVFAVYGLNDEPVSSADFKAVEFVGYDGTFDPTKVIAYEKTQLKSASTVSPGPHGGQMTCGVATSGGSQYTECVWVTSTTFGEVDFVVGQSLATFTGNPSVITMNIRGAVETAVR